MKRLLRNVNGGGAPSKKLRGYEDKKVSCQASLRYPELDSGSINFYDNAIAEQVRNDGSFISPSPNLGEGRGEVKKSAFTLAEVLITLGIIGVVAAMTMPVLVANISDKVLENQNKKAQSVFANGMRLLMTNEDVTRLQDTSFFQCNLDKDCMSNELKKVFKIIDDGNDNLLSTEYEFSDESKEVWSNDSIIPYTFVTSDGVIYGIQKDDENSSFVNVIVDVNGIKRPNKGGKDLCKYSVSDFGKLSADCEAMTTFRTSTCSVDNLRACTQSECEALGGAHEWSRRGCTRLE